MLSQNDLDLFCQPAANPFKVLTGSLNLFCILPQCQSVMPSSVIVSIILQLDAGQQHPKRSTELGHSFVRLLFGILQSS
jgi:hypothetical protein